MARKQWVAGGWAAGLTSRGPAVLQVPSASSVAAAAPAAFRRGAFHIANVCKRMAVTVGHPELVDHGPPAVPGTPPRRKFCANENQARARGPVSLTFSAVFFFRRALRPSAPPNCHALAAAYGRWCRRSAASGGRNRAALGAAAGAGILAARPAQRVTHPVEHVWPGGPVDAKPALSGRNHVFLPASMRFLFPVSSRGTGSRIAEWLDP